MERKLVTIRKVKEIRPISGADRIELVIVDGWQCVVKKGEFVVGDKGVYFEIDSFLPLDERFEFLRSSSFRKMGDGTEGFRLKTIRFKGQISQGLLLPLNGFTEINSDDYNGNDLSVELNVKKFEAPLPAQLAGKVKGGFPGFLFKTDQERIQNLTDFFTVYKNLAFEETEKIDGTSATFYVRNGEFGVCSRNLELLEDQKNSLWKVVHAFGIKETLLDLNRNIAIQGEVAGEGIQKNPLKIIGQRFFIFDIFDIDNGFYLTSKERSELLKSWNNSKLEHVPILKEESYPFKEFTTMDTLLDHAQGQMTHNSKGLREGIVYKSCERIHGRIISFKAINNEFLLKHQ